MDVQVKLAETPEERQGAVQVRLRVFVEEQGVPTELEMDEHDAAALHAVALAGGWVVGTGRLLRHADGEGRIGRMAVLPDWRRRGVGGRLLALLEGEARSRGLRRIVLHAQAYVTDFYARHGYREEGGPFLEAGIPHITMTKLLEEP